MPILQLRFPAGRYHATPWGRHVNEGEPEWPPSPFRIARALLDMWYRRCTAAVSAQDMEAVLQLFAGCPRFALPPSGRAVTKSYLSSNTTVFSDKEPVLDAFVTLMSGAVVCMELPAASRTTLEALRELVSHLNYLGRSESWTAAEVADSLPDGCQWNCVPKAEQFPAHELLTVNLLRTPSAYLDLPYLPRKKSKSKKVPPAPLSWSEALCLSTKELFEQGWNRHPLLSATPYVYTASAPCPLAVPQTEVGCVTYALQGNVLPLVEHTFPFAKRVRRVLMGIHRVVMGGDPARCSWRFSGKDAAGNPLTGHRHAFFWPLDLDGDGRLDHLRIYTNQSFTADELEALYRLNKVWTPGKADDLQLRFLHALSTPPQTTSTIFESRTPVVMNRNWRKGRGSFAEWLRQEIRQECARHGLPEPTTVKPLAVDYRERRWASFVRGEQNTIPKQGYGFCLEFERPVPGPFSLGALAHYGFGMFEAP